MVRLRTVKYILWRQDHQVSSPLSCFLLPRSPELQLSDIQVFIPKRGNMNLCRIIQNKTIPITINVSFIIVYQIPLN
jgi:hypothetical protein